MDVTHLHHEEDEAVLSWLETVWNYLRQHYPSNLSSVTGLPILAVHSDDHTAIHILSSPSKVALQSAKGYTISEGVQEGLCCLGVELVSELHHAVANHAAVLGNYVHVPQAEDLLKAALVAHKTGKQSLETFGVNASSTSRSELCELWSKLVPGELSAEDRAYLTDLPLFRVWGKSDDPVVYVNAATVRFAAPLEVPPVPAPTRMLNLKDEAPRMLAKLLGITPMKLSQYFSQHVFPNLHLFHEDKEAMMKTMDFMMDRLPLLQQENARFMDDLTNLKFVPNLGGGYKVPSELFDPEDELVKYFFIGDDAFPGGRYQQPEILVILRKLGLQGAAQIQARHVLFAIKSLQQHAAASDDMKMCLEKAKAIFQHLSNHPHQLREVVDGQPLSAWISNMAWVPTQQHPPSIYPNNMPWFESPLFEVPRNIFSPEWSALIGSVAPVMLSEPSKTLAETFTWQNPPPLGVVLKQLKVLIQNYVSTDKAQLLTLISSMYGRLSSESGLHLQESLIDVGLSSWIWNGDGFSEPESIVVKKYQLDLTPYCFTLPSEIAMYQDLFVNCGASHEVTDEVLVLVLTSMKNKYSLKTEKSPDTDRLKNEKENCARDLQMSVDVLNILKSHHLSPELLGRVFIPVETELEGICFLPVDACTYCDIEWLQQGFSLQSFDEKDGIHLIHPNLPVATAEALRVPTLMSRMLLAEEFDAWGQQESLTDRLHQLLEEYSDGFAIFKELIQNADDAGATTVKILYDERQNEEFTTYLLDKGMKHCQGPALWVYNDAMFTDQDFKNITQLGGATKEAQLDKIGRFGLGFNAVYNITDVPSFISRNCLVIFDPHLTHLGTARRDRTSPGIRIDLQKSGHRTLIRKLPDQFEPYRKVFGCEIGYEAENHFNGTLFRFPLRDRQQSQKSKISCRHYDHQEITDLLTFLVQGAPNLLMFTQNVKNVEVFHLSPGKKNPENASEILSIHKDLVNTLNVIGNTEFNNSLNPLSRMLSIGAKYIDDVKDKRQDFDKSQIPSATCVVRMTVNVTDNGESLTSQKAYTSEQLWLISTTVGQKQSLSLGLEKNNLIPVASVAAPLCYESDVLKPVPVESIGQKGHLFCFLPLPIESGLPVHVNGAFAVQSNRRYLAEQTEDDKFCVKAEWNRALVQDAVMYAYEKLLVSMCQLPQNGTTLFTDLWPNSKNALPIMSPLIQEFYGRLSGESQSVPVCFDGKEHVPISDAIFLDPVLRDNSEVGDKAMSIFQQYSPGSVAFDLSNTIRQSFVAAKQHNYINKKTYSEVDFFSKVFLQQIADIDSETRDALVWYILNQPNLTNLAMTLPCILVDCKGNSASVFKVPSELFDPDDELVKRFFLGDDVFPGGRYQQPEILVILRKLGLKGAAQIQARHVLLVIQSLQQHAAASDDMKMCLEKAKAIFQHLSNHPHQLREVVDGQPLSAWISNMAWVPTQQHPPSIYPNNMPWFESPLFEVPRNIFSPEWSALIGSVAPVMLSEPSKTLAETFTWQNPPPLGVVLKQLKVLIQNYVSTDKAQLLTLISSIYGRLSSEGALHLQESLITAGLSQWIWNGEGFSELQSIVVKRYQLDLSPYCYTLPSEIAMYQDFFVRCGASYEVTDEVLVLVLTAMKNKYTMETDHLAEVDKLKSMEGHYTQDLQLSVAQDLQLSVNVLNILKSHVTTISPALLGNLLVPVETKVGSFCLLPIADCTYYDIKWLQQGFSPQSWDEDDGINFIHPNLPMATAQALGVPTLMSRMLDADELEVTAWGQQESLTDRLHQLLEEYSDGFAIFKELIQNADDAGATTVKILYDERQNEEFTTYLLDEGMKHCQGPALWVYNDALFTDQDLKNITKLGAATKEAQLDKIGQFGLGFNAVYNITDVPSFISRNYLVIFDPHLTHLGTARRDRKSPGIMIDIQKSGHQTLIRKLPDQFEPYRKVFGCEIGCQTENHFNGTLFRFPLRDREQSRKSKICCHHYDHKDMTDLLRFLVQGAPNLLLFTQNVKNVEVFHLPSCEKDPENATEILSIHRDLVNTGITEFSDPLNFLSRMLSVGAKYMDDLKDKRQDFDKSQTPSATCVVRMTVNVTDNGESLTSQKSGSSEQLWLISTTVGQKQSLSLGLEKDNLIPVASVAAPLCYKGDVLKPVPVESIGQKGHLFCFLPLPIESGLPVHVNGAFAVQSNRRYLCEQTEDDKFCAKAKWNEALLKDPVIFAYEKLLLGMCQLPQCGITLFTELWPNLKDVSPAMSPLIEEFYARLSEESQPIPVCFDGKKPVPISETIFLDPVLRDNPEVGDKAMSIFEHYSPDCPFAFDLPNTIRQSFVAAKQQHYIDKKTYTEVDFFTKVFFKEITGIDAEPRDALMCYILDKQDDDLTVIAMTSPCIPVSPEGKKLKYPNETIHPRESAAKLYAPEDERFPYGANYCTVERLLVLEKLGMQSSDLHWRDIYERAESIAKLKENSMVKRRQRLLLDFLDEKLKKLSDGNGKQSCKAEQCGTDIESAGENLQKIPFLSPLKKPEAFPLPWHAELLDEDTLLAAENMYPKDCKYLLSCSQYIVNENMMTTRVKKLLGLANKEFRTEFVLTQFKHALQADPRSLGFTPSKTLDHLCFAVYGYLQQKCEQDPQLGEYLRNTYQNIPCILLGGKYVKPSEAAFISKTNFEPYLHHIDKPDFRPIYSILGVREKFETKDFVAALQQMQTENDGKPLNSGHLKISLDLIRGLDDCMTENEMNVEEVCQLYGTIYIPDSRGILHRSTILCYNDCPWLPDSEEAKFTNEGVTRATSQRLGVKSKRQEALNGRSQGIPFGQKENLICSLKRILKNYPFDCGILKEFVQNADDAKAKMLHFVLDERTHPASHIFDDSWKPLQGPALCIYNDRSFSVADLEGIQRLGFGSKTYDPNRTGEYGIGFCSAYHLTDAPSLLSKGGELGDTLCVFDPMCKYVPGATSAEPGRRYTDLNKVRDAFPDVFSGYLEDIFIGKNCTVFRLPLRSKDMALPLQSKDMAEELTISHTPVTLCAVREMLRELQSEALDILLFTNNLQQLHFSQISSDGGLQGTYSVKSTLHPFDEKSRSDFFSYVKQVGHQLREKLVCVEDIMLKDVMYDVTLSDNRGIEELWRVCQRIGTAPDQKVPVTCKEAFDHRELCLLPRGGTACFIKRKTSDQNYVPPYKSKRERKVFCSLPLPQETGLSMHINGHFAFHFENRRHLWQGKNDDYRQAWNNFLFSDLIAPCYLDLMKSMRLQHLAVKIDGDITHLTCSRERLQAAIKKHQKLFPVFNHAHPDFEVLVKAVLCQSAELDIPILPSIIEEQNFSMGYKEVGYRVIWLPPCGKGCKKAFFSVESDHGILKDVLKACGFNVVEAGPEILKSYEYAGVNIQYMSPDEVNLFFQSCTSGKCMGHAGELPCELEYTPFGNITVLKIFLDFCKRDPLFPQKLEGLPLCFTGDGRLQVFHASDPKFPAAHQNLVQECAGQFLHHEISETLLKGLDFDNTPVVRRFDIEAFASMLHKKFEQAVYCQNESPVKWKKRFSYFPPQHWIKNVWHFLREEIVGSANRADAMLNGDEVKQALAPLSNWCILPATCKGDPELYSISNGEQVLDLRCSNSHSNWETLTTKAVEILKALGVPLIDTSSLEWASSSTIADFVRNVVTTMDNPVGVLKAALRSCNSYKGNISHVVVSQAWGLLGYFSRNITTIRNEPGALEMLRQLPVYRTVHEDVIPLTGCVVYTLPEDIPVADMDVWRNKSGTVFLAHDKELEPIYSALRCVSVTGLEVYCQFILQHFELISYNAQLIHLHHLYKTYLHTCPDVQVSDSDRNRLLNCCKKLYFLEDRHGYCQDLRCASDFFDPEIKLFLTMKSHELPPKAQRPFLETDWLTLLRMMGLQTQVTSEMCLEFASHIAHLGKDPGNVSTQEKSKALIQHLFKMKDAGSRDKILTDVAHVSFVQPEKASRDLCLVYHQHGDQGDGKIPYVCFENSFSSDNERLVWTLASLLPSWADPSKQHYLKAQDVTHIQKCLGMHARPPLELVVQHLRTLLSHIMANLECLPDFDVLIHLFKPVYLYLQEHMADNSGLLQGLDDLPCVLVQGRMPFIKAHFTVLNLGRGEEISEYLLRVPAELGECHTLFLKLGAQDHVTVDQYAGVLECLHDKVPNDVLLPNELRVAYKAIKGLAETLLKEKNPVQSKSLYLPDEKGQLRDVSQLVFNDAPAYYDRVQGFDFHFLFDTSECGIEYRRFEEVFHLLPSALQPSYMSEHVKETLVKSSRDSVTVIGLAALMDKRLHSELFQKAVARLARHEAYKSGQRLQDDTLAHALDQLSVVKLKVWSVERLQTVLKCKGKKISESQSDKSCFVEKEGTAGNIESWNIYLHQAASLSQDIQILLAGAVNTILGGLLRDSALFLQPLLVCPEADIEARLDAMNIRLDYSSCRACVRTLPTPGEPVSNVHRQWICASPGGDFQKEEFVAFKESSEADFVYAVVEEDVTSTGNNPSAQFCRISLGPECPPESKALNTLHKIERGS